MSAEPRCVCCDLPVYSCGRDAETRLRQARQARVRQLLERGYTAASFPGLCGQCADPIAAGDPIVKRDGVWVGGLCCGADIPASAW
jgi:hypothetical protein